MTSLTRRAHALDDIEAGAGLSIGTQAYPRRNPAPWRSTSSRCDRSRGADQSCSWREALRRLEAEGFIEYERNVGARIRTLDASSWSETLQTIAALDGYATRLALDYVRPEDITKAREANRRMARAIRDAGPEQVKRANQDVHAPITGRCPNAYLRDLLQASWARLYISELGSVFLYHPEQATRQIAEHESVLSMIESRADPEAVEQAVRGHTLDLVSALAAGPSRP